MSAEYDPFARPGPADDRLVPFVRKGWGWERVVANGPPYCCKELVFCRGRRCSYHYHRLKTETFLLASGEVVVSWVGPDAPPPASADEAMKELSRANRTVLRPGGVFHIPPLTRHRVYAREDSKIIEVSTQHFEDDSHRLIHGD